MQDLIDRQAAIEALENTKEVANCKGGELHAGHEKRALTEASAQGHTQHYTRKGGHTQ